MRKGQQSIHDIYTGEINLRKSVVCEKVMDLLYPRMLFFAAEITKSREVAKDIAQDAFVYVIEKNLVFENINTLKAYLYTTVKNKCLNYLRDYREKITLEDAHNTPTKDTQIDHLIIKQELKARVISEINKLPEMQRQIMLLRLEEKSYDQIAKQLSLSINTIKAYKKTAYKQLRVRLGGYNKNIGG